MLLTDWLVLATEGKTIDGRTIKQSWLKDISDTYDRDLYTAIINADHIRLFGNYGLVHDVRLGSNKHGDTTLEGRISPNYRLLEQNRNGQRLFLSIEVLPNFRNSGKAYLGGLAITDDPASVGTSQLQFHRQQDGQASDFIALPEQLLPDTDKPDDTETPFEHRLMRALKKLVGMTATTPSDHEPLAMDVHTDTTDITLDTQDDSDTMTSEQFEQLTQLLSQQQQAITDLTTTLTPADNTEPENPADPNAAFAQLKASHETLLSQFKTLSDKLDAALKGQPGTSVPDTESSTTDTPAFI